MKINTNIASHTALGLLISLGLAACGKDEPKKSEQGTSGQPTLQQETSWNHTQCPVPFTLTARDGATTVDPSSLLKSEGFYQADFFELFTYAGLTDKKGDIGPAGKTHYGSVHMQAHYDKKYIAKEKGKVKTTCDDQGELYLSYKGTQPYIINASNGDILKNHEMGRYNNQETYINAASSRANILASEKNHDKNTAANTQFYRLPDGRIEIRTQINTNEEGNSILILVRTIYKIKNNNPADIDLDLAKAIKSFFEGAGYYRLDASEMTEKFFLLADPKEKFSLYQDVYKFLVDTVQLYKSDAHLFTDQFMADDINRQLFDNFRKNYQFAIEVQGKHRSDAFKYATEKSKLKPLE